MSLKSAIRRGRKFTRNISRFLHRPISRFCAKPSFLIVGAQKAGTSSLHNYLGQHPSIRYSLLKREIHYFDLNYFRGDHWYLSHFPIKNKAAITFEKSPYYLFHPLASKRSYIFNPSLNIIMLLRDPVKRAYSHYHHEVDKGREIRPFRDAVEEEMAKVEIDHSNLLLSHIEYSFTHHRYSYFARGKYADQIDLWRSYFPEKQIFIETAENFFRDPIMVCEKIFALLNLHSFQPSTNKRFNIGSYPTISSDDKQWLSKKFYQHNLKLEKCYGINISEWT
jgi:hypothetical protein